LGGVAVRRRPEHEKPRHCQAKLLEASGMAGSRGTALVAAPGSSGWVWGAALDGRRKRSPKRCGGPGLPIAGSGVEGVGDSSGAVDLAPR
jgi:hypothetical protein